MTDARSSPTRQSRPPRLALAGMALAALAALTGCDAGVDRAAQQAVARTNPTQTLPTRALGPAEVIVEAYVAQMGEVSRAYDEALRAAGYVDALAEAALTTSGEFALGPARIAAAKKAAAHHKAQALAHTDAAAARLKALAPTPEKAPLVAKMVEEFAAVRTRRAAHWDEAARIMDETHAAWVTLDTAQGDWALKPDGLKFTSMKDKEAYDRHAARIGALIARQDNIIEAQTRSAASLRQLSRLYGS